MESDSWSRFSAAAMLSKRLHSAAVAAGSGGAQQSRHHDEHSSSRDANIRALRDLLLGMEEGDDGEEEDAKAEYACPFCYEDFDVIGLCCHVEDEHPAEARNGVCPVCVSRIGLDLVGHITTQHGSFYKIQRRRFRRGSSASQAMLSLLKKDIREGTLQTLLRDTSYPLPSGTGTSDPFLSSLIYSLPEGDSSKDLEGEALDETALSNKSSDENAPVARNEPSLSDKDLKEQVIRSKFVQELVLSTIYDDVL